MFCVNSHKPLLGLIPDGFYKQLLLYFTEDARLAFNRTGTLV